MIKIIIEGVKQEEVWRCLQLLKEAGFNGRVR